MVTERRKSFGEREIIKKERRDGRKCSKQVEEKKKEELPKLPEQTHAVDTWIFDVDDFTDKVEEEKRRILLLSFLFLLLLLQCYSYYYYNYFVFRLDIKSQQF